MMPYCASSLCASALSTLQLQKYDVQDHAPSSLKVKIWRQRIRALVFLCTLLLFLNPISAFADDRGTGHEGFVEDAAVESETSETAPALYESRFKSSRECLLKKTIPGLTTMNELHSVPRLTDWPLQSLQRQQGTGRRVLVSSACTNKDISIFQSPDGSSGLPRYVVQIMNNCMSECAPSNIHVFCGWFASALLVNPNSFKRLSFDDCLVNDGLPLKHGETLRFTYANSFMYPLRFKSASFCK